MSKDDIPHQLGLFDRSISQIEEKPQEKEKLLEDRLTDFKPSSDINLSRAYLLSLSDYNEQMRNCGSAFQNSRWGDSLEDDNILLRQMFHGKENSSDMPKSIYQYLNGLEIAMITAGTFIRKYTRDEFDINTKRQGDNLLHVKTNHQNKDQSKIASSGILDGSTYQIIEYLMGATHIDKIKKNYQTEWKNKKDQINPNTAVKRFKKFNPFNPNTLQQRMEQYEIDHPEDARRIRYQLAKPFVPEKVRVYDRGNWISKTDNFGFETPGRTFKKGVKGKSFYRIGEYGTKVMDHFNQLR